MKRPAKTNTISRLFSRILKPEYVHRPSSLVQRTKIRAFAGTRSRVVVRLPWGTSLRVNPRENIGGSIVDMGVFDLLLTETVWRLSGPEGIHLDIGANIGYTAGIMASRCKTGSVICFEPSPKLHSWLAGNIASMAATMPNISLEIKKFGLSDCAGSAVLTFDPMERNIGKGSIVEAESHSGNTVEIRLRRLDDVLSDIEKVQLAKIDVEGHELKVLRGADSILSEKRIVHIVFESHEPFPNPLTDFLNEKGYRIFGMRRTLARPELAPPDEDRLEKWETRNLIATADEAGLVDRFRQKGWLALSGI